MKTGFQRKIAVAVMSFLFLCSISISCFASESATKASTTDNYYPYIINTLPVDGTVHKLIVPKSAPNLLYAAVANSGRPKKTTDNTGLYVFDISDVTRIVQIAHFPITSPMGMDISLDEKTLLLYSSYHQGDEPNSWYGIVVLDVNNPKALREIGRVELDIKKARLSADEKYLFVTEKALIRKKEERYFFSIFEVSHDGSPSWLHGCRLRIRGLQRLKGFTQFPVESTCWSKDLTMT